MIMMVWNRLKKYIEVGVKIRFSTYKCEVKEMLEIGDRVKVLYVPKKYKNKYELSATGTLNKIYRYMYGVQIDGVYNNASSEGLFWFFKPELEKIHNKGDRSMSQPLTGYNYVAIVHLEEDYNKKDYGFALYDPESSYAKVGDYVMVNPKNKFTLGVIQQIMSPDEYGKPVEKEVVSLCKTHGYEERVAARNEEIERQRKEMEIRKELDERISKLKDIEYYNNMATRFADKDPVIANLVSEFGAIVKIKE